MRGTPQGNVRHHRRAGIIPAYAGNTFDWVDLRGFAPQDHPRVCGEHGMEGPGYDSRGGSSPRMRGTQSATHEVVNTGGIIPAYAGNTLRDYSNFVVSKFMSFVFHLV